MLQTFTHLAGVPLHYDRYPEESGDGYGTRGRPFHPQATPAMIEALETCFKALFKACPWKKAEVITSAGAYTNKSGYHGRGKAIDIDGLFWSSGRKLIAIEFPEKPHLYLAVESVFRQHFGTVLAYNYNLMHRDHFHIDVGTPVGFSRTAKSRVEYLQASILYIHGFEVGGIDGVWGPDTSSATRRAFHELDIGIGPFNKESWLEYLRVTATKGFSVGCA